MLACRDGPTPARALLDMLFNSLEFILVFLPVAILGHVALGNDRQRTVAWLTAVSAVFYGYWNIKYLVLLVGLLIGNFVLGRHLQRSASRRMLIVGVAVNLGVLAVFKYSAFFATEIVDALKLVVARGNSPAAATIAFVEKVSAGVRSIELPLGISFFTFQKIAYLLDCYRKRVPRHSFISFALFVLFFPQLIAGPIVHGREVLPQFNGLSRVALAPNMALGLTMFVAGLAKKVLLADNLAPISAQIFDAAARGQPVEFASAWIAVIAYGLQIYFDFSGYSDMAIALARMFGVYLPANFNSPYQAVSITDFWRRWHVTLSRFLRDYLYIPLGGNRRGVARQYVALLITMSLGGLWHGAAWTFVLWGCAHGLVLALHKAWRSLALAAVPVPLARALTFAIVTFLWVPFRAADIGTTAALWTVMLGGHGLGGAPTDLINMDYYFGVVVAVGLVIVLALPNLQTVLRRYRPVLTPEGAVQDHEPLSVPRWRPNLVLAVIIGIFLATCLLELNEGSRFIYFQF